MPTNQKRYLLLVEDDANDAELTTLLLRKCEPTIEVALARDGAEALDYLYRRGPHAARPPGEPVVVLLDLKMPKVSGTEVLRELKADPRLKTIPVVILTSSREARDLRECYELGSNGYVVKPVDAKQFTQAIQSVGAFWTLTNEPVPE